jgi:hypothetical protein
VGRHQLAAPVFGEGTPVVVIEPSFGGAAVDWEKIARILAEETMVITYDRAPYGASSAVPDARTPHDIAADLEGLLRELLRHQGRRAVRQVRCAPRGGGLRLRRRVTVSDGE